MKILIFLGFIILGFLLVVYSKYITDNTGRFPWIERTLGDGATYSLWKFFGILAIAFAFYYLITF